MIARVALALFFLIAPAMAKSGLFHGHGGGSPGVFLVQDGTGFFIVDNTGAFITVP